MTQESRPVGQHVDNYPDGDSGPYSSGEWRALFSALFTNDPTTQGPIQGNGQELYVVNPTGKVIRVFDGAGIVNGNIFFNDADVDFTPPTPTGDARIDRVVMCLNETDSSFSTSDAGFSLTFPDTLTDYGGSASIPPYACRLVIVRGTEGAGLPTLDQNPNHYMVPLAHYIISTAGVVSSMTDERNFALSPLSPAEVFVPALCGYNATLDADIYREMVSLTRYYSAVQFPDGNSCWAYGNWLMPPNYNPSISVTAILVPRGTGASGNIYSQSVVRGGALCTGTTAGSGSVVGGPAQISVSSDIQECVQEISTTTFAGGDLLHFAFNRQGNETDDDLGEAVDFLGWRVRLLG